MSGIVAIKNNPDEEWRKFPSPFSSKKAGEKCWAYWRAAVVMNSCGELV
jgi:hypothetical protein